MRKKQVVDGWIRKLGIDADTVIEVWSNGSKKYGQRIAGELWRCFSLKVINTTFDRLEQEMKKEGVSRD
jgi:hypothetical protein